MATYYELLGCDKTASYEELKKSYHEQAKKLHPDKARHDTQQKFLLLDKAWKTLRNTNSRKEYDLSIAKNDMDEMPLYCEVSLSEMNHDPETGSYSYTCRCGGIYILEGGCVDESEGLKVCCDECTFHILIHLNK